MICALLALALASPSVAVAPNFPGGPLEPLQPRDHVSASGEGVLHVDPSQRYGAGPARYRMTRRGIVLWEYEQPFTFQEAFVASDGSSVGYAYTTGSVWETGDGSNDLVFARLGIDGIVRVEERTPFVRQMGFCPYVNRFLPCPEVDKVVLEVSEQPPSGVHGGVFPVVGYSPESESPPGSGRRSLRRSSVKELGRAELRRTSSRRRSSKSPHDRSIEGTLFLVDPFARLVRGPDRFLGVGREGHLLLRRPAGRPGHRMAAFLTVAGGRFFGRHPVSWSHPIPSRGENRRGAPGTQVSSGHAIRSDGRSITSMGESCSSTSTTGSSARPSAEPTTAGSGASGIRSWR